MIKEQNLKEFILEQRIILEKKLALRNIIFFIEAGFILLAMGLLILAIILEGIL